MGLRRFVDINIFVIQYYISFSLFIFSISSNLLNQIYKMLRPEKGNSRVLLNDTL